MLCEEEFITYGSPDSSVGKDDDLLTSVPCTSTLIASKAHVKESWKKFCKAILKQKPQGYFFDLFSKEYAPFNFHFLSSLKVCFRRLAKDTDQCDIFLTLLKIGIKGCVTSLDKQLQKFSMKLEQLTFQSNEDEKTTLYVQRILRFELEIFLDDHNLTHFFTFNKKCFKSNIEFLKLEQYVKKQQPNITKLSQKLESVNMEMLPQILKDSLQALKTVITSSIMKTPLQKVINLKEPFVIIPQKKFKTDTEPFINMMKKKNDTDQIVNMLKTDQLNQLTSISNQVVKILSSSGIPLDSPLENKFSPQTFAIINHDVAFKTSQTYSNFIHLHPALQEPKITDSTPLLEIMQLHEEIQNLNLSLTKYKEELSINESAFIDLELSKKDLEDFNLKLSNELLQIKTNFENQQFALSTLQQEKASLLLDKETLQLHLNKMTDDFQLPKTHEVTKKPNNKKPKEFVNNWTSLNEVRNLSQIGCGLVNLGNTCYINSVLQCLIYSPLLASHVMLPTKTYTQCPTHGALDYCLWCHGIAPLITQALTKYPLYYSSPEFAVTPSSNKPKSKPKVSFPIKLWPQEQHQPSLLNNPTTPKNPNVVALKPYGIRNWLFTPALSRKKLHHNFRSGEQEDAQEFLKYVLEFGTQTDENCSQDIFNSLFRMHFRYYKRCTECSANMTHKPETQMYLTVVYFSATELDYFF